MNTSIEKIIHEYSQPVEGLAFPVKGRVSEQLDSDPNHRYSWSVSHYYRPSETAAGVYYPSKKSFRTAEDAEAFLRAYMSGFTTLDVTANQDY